MSKNRGPRDDDVSPSITRMPRQRRSGNPPETPVQMSLRCRNHNRWVSQQQEELKKNGSKYLSPSDRNILKNAREGVARRLHLRDEQNRMYGRMKGGVAR